ncbi:MAG TPA: hypothetical protein VGG41_08545 [Solirubrobacteraceae bacterium]
MLSTSGVVTRQGVGWFAVDLAAGFGADESIHVYRWDGDRWSLDGTVAVSGTPGGLGMLRSAQLTHSTAPDFTFADGNGADWVAFVVVAERHGSWRAVPFESGAGVSTVADAGLVQGDRVLGENNPCGCAAGPWTHIWYRFNGTIFVPTSPPGPAAPCTVAAMNAAKPLLGGYPGIDSWTPADLAAHVTVSRISCLDGWALATATRDGASIVALYERAGNGWLRAAVGSVHELNSNINEFALPTPVLRRLETNIGLQGVPPPRSSADGPGPTATTTAASRRPSTTPAAVPIAPGSRFADSNVINQDGTDWFAAAAVSPSVHDTAALTLYAYRWTGHAWSLSGHVHVAHVAGVEGGYYPSVQITGAPTTTGPAFFVKPPFTNHPLATIIDTGGHWHADG